MKKKFLSIALGVMTAGSTLLSSAVEISDSIGVDLKLVAPVKIEGKRDVNIGTYLVDDDNNLSEITETHSDQESGYFLIEADEETVVQLHFNGGEPDKEGFIVMNHVDDNSQKLYVPYYISISEDSTTGVGQASVDGTTEVIDELKNDKDWYQFTVSEKGDNIFIIPGAIEDDGLGNDQHADIEDTEFKKPAVSSYKPGIYQGTVVATVFYN